MFILLLQSAWALDADTYAPSGTNPSGEGGLQIPAPLIGNPDAWYAGAQLVYAHRPVVQQWPDGTETPLITGSTALHLLGGYTVQKIVRLDIDVPTYLWQGISASGGDSGPAFGDIRLSGTFAIFRSPLLTVGATPALLLPTGAAARFTGAGGVSGGLTMSARAQATEEVSFDASLGVLLGPDSSLGEELYGSNFQWGLGGGWRRDRIGAGAELTGALSLADGVGSWNQNPAELHGWGSYAASDNVLLTAGLGTGIVAGVGAPDVRLILGFSWHDPGFLDTDGDGLEDREDDCPTEPEDKDGFNDQDGCIDPDNDGDGVKDPVDACPTSPEDIDGFKDSDGCPEPDNDQDTILDSEDACPDLAGPLATGGCPDKDGDTVPDATDRCPAEPGPATNGGCPVPVVPVVPVAPEPDQDKDQVPDSRDRCPTEPRNADDPPATSDGCPKRVLRQGSNIVILEVVYFDTGKSTIQARSFSLLDEVAATITANPDITLIEVGGHTDNQGSVDVNLRLSQARAQAVVDYLVRKGVAASRLRAVGYGPGVPTDTNSTAAGRTNNRRVEFKILEVDNQPLPKETP